MDLSFGTGIFVEKNKQIEGEIILSEHKLFLKSQEEDLTDTYVPLEKIEKLKLSSNRMDVHVRPNMTFPYVASFKGKAKAIKSLAAEIVHRRGLKKKFLRKEWVEDPT